jgi:hypothetical protein
MSEIGLVSCAKTKRDEPATPNIAVYRGVRVSVEGVLLDHQEGNSIEQHS